MNGRDFTALCNLTVERAYNVNMVIEIDRKKVAKVKRDARIGVVGYILFVLLKVYQIVSDFMQGYPLSWVYVVSLLVYLLIAAACWGMVRRALRHRRTDHHLYMDSTGLAMINGHARVDIPWGDVENVVKRGFGGDSSLFPPCVKVQLRKESPYSKRTYRLYNDYEQPLSVLYTQVSEMWTAGQAKPKLLTI